MTRSRPGTLLVALAVVGLWSVSASAETYRFVDPDGTVHFTNAPTDPLYRRMGFTSGTEEGWLRLPIPDLVPYAREILAPFAREIKDAAERYGVPEGLISAVIRVESGFNSRAISRKGARGLMQLMPATASMLGVQDSFDPRQNIDGGVRHLRGLIDRFGNDFRLALAAYNAGEQAVANYRGIPPYPETRDYVTRVLGLFGGTTAPAAPSPAPPPPPEFYRVVDSDGTTVYTNVPPNGRF